MMKLVRSLIGIIALTACCVTRADEPTRVDSNASALPSAKQPEVGYVGVSRALVYSGPSEDYYPTNQLSQGSAVEIYHRTEAGWLAIRPPAGSFSWIPATDCYLLPGGKQVEITAKNCVSWIGTTLGTAKQYRWQVQLHIGEQLTRLGEESIKDKEGKETLWYKIAPPSGEFRWIQSGTITRQPPENMAKQSLANNSKVVPAAGQKMVGSKSSVKPAGLVAKQEQVEGIVLEGSSPGSEIILDDGAMQDGGVMEGEVIYDGEVYEGDIEGEGYIVTDDVVPEHDANWNDWQLFEFTDEGLRLPFLERAAAWRNTQPDSLAADPFSLDMAPKKKGQLRPGLPDPTPAVPNRRRTPWRDPRELSEQRMMGFPQARGERGMGTTLSALRGTLDQNRAGGYGANNLDRSNYSPQMNSGPSSNGSGSFPNEPRMAPNEWSTTGGGNGAGGNGFGSGGRVDMPNLPADPFANSSNSSWTGRNWFGLGNRATEGGDRAGLGMQPMLDAGTSAVAQLQQRLSEMVTRPMQHWNFGELKERVQYFINNGSSPAERGQARLLMERIGEFERHAMRTGYSLSSLQGNSSATTSNNLTSHSSTANSSITGSSITGSSITNSSTTNSSLAGGHLSPAPPVTAAGSAAVVTASYNTPAPASGSDTIGNRNFDATGWLVPVYAAQPGQPTHALNSDSGQVVAYVTAIPGMNLDTYINHPVGIQGLRGYLQEFRAAHIEAQNITRLR